MLSLGGRSLLQPSVRAVCRALVIRKSPSPALISHHGVPVRPLSGGWYGSVADSAPVHLAEDFLLHLQQASGLPWWLSITVSTLSIRTLVTLPLSVYQMVIIARVEALQVEISELAKRLRYGVSVRAKERSWTDKQSRFQFSKNLRSIVSQLYVRDNCHPFKASLLVWVQLPLWISMSLALRNLSLDQSGDTSAGNRWGSLVSRPDSSGLYLDPACVSGTHQPGDCGALFTPESEPISVSEECDLCLPRLFSADDPHRCLRPLVHVSVLVDVQFGRTRSQPHPAFSCSP
ncbi:cytochrome c oxidase assembly protein COX18, mitochondrial isoform 2-T3 [Aulostomus maculatus]